MAERTHLSIGEVLSLLQDDFPDVTISKIRFLESQGLLDPERTPSGYRKFYEADIERLRWILRHQRDHFLPLKVMKDRLEESTAAGLMVPPDEPASAAPDAPPSLFGDEVDGARAARPVSRARTVAALIEGPPAAKSGADPTPVLRHARPNPPLPPLPAASTGAPNPLDGGPTGVSFTIEELAASTGLSHRDLGDLTRYGLLSGYQVGGDTFYDGDALVVARTAAGFMRFGIEARHLRMYKVAAEREAGFMEQVVMPLLKQRNPTARQQAADNLGEMAKLGEMLRTALLRAALRGHTAPGR
ncbi:MAG: MerR family transcriptional regulator [Microthrixaceae bacterium]